MNTEYLHDVMTGQGISNKATHLIRKIKESGVDFDAIAFRGHEWSIDISCCCCSTKQKG